MEVSTQWDMCKVSDDLLMPEGRHVNFAWDLLCSYFHDPQKNEIHLLYLRFRNNFHNKSQLNTKELKMIMDLDVFQTQFVL